jgi:Ala-tRNA(Pro) deacylase
MKNIEKYTLYSTRPADKRLPKEERVYDLLEALGVPFVRIDHDAIATIDGCAEIEELLGIEICKNLFLRNSKGDEYYLLTLPGHKKLVTREIAKQIGSTRLSFGDESKLLEYLDITPGSVSLLGLMNDKNLKVRFLIDRDLLGYEYIGCHPCINTTSLKLRTDDILNKILPAVNHTPQFVEI